MTIKKVLFNTRFRELAFSALEAVLELKKAGLEEIVLAYIIPREDVAFVPYGGYLKDEEARLQETACLRFDQWRETIEKQGIKATIRIETGMRNAKILQIAEEENIDLIVTGRKKRSLFEKVYAAEHILDLLRRSHTPILMEKYMVQFKWNDEVLTRINDHIFRRPLLAADWSTPSENALEFMRGFKGLAEKIIVVHVIGAKLSKGLTKAALKKLEAESKKRLEAYCRRLNNAGFEAESDLSIGKTAAEIIRLSRERGATMIAMGRTGKDWFKQYWLGGASHRVAELSELPVLLVP